MKSASCHPRWAFGFGLWALGSLFATQVHAADKTTAGELFTEPPTLLSLGFEWRIDGDDNRNAQVAVSYRKAGEQTWKAGPALLRIGNERVGPWFLVWDQGQSTKNQGLLPV